jgi:hypothetical protein
MKVERRQAVLAAFAVLSVTACNAILGLGDYFNECGGPLDAPCNTTSSSGAGGSPTTSSSTNPGGGGAGGTGGMTACKPHETKVCGPTGTLKGVCKRGVETCKDDGSGFDACTGVFPSDELCSSTADENCDGLDCVLWSQDLGQGQTEAFVISVAYDPTAKDFVLVGGFAGGSLTLGGKTISVNQEFDGFLARVGSDGVATVLKPFGTVDNDAILSVAVDSQGAILMSGTTNGTLTDGSVSFGPGGFVAKLDAMGNATWAKTYASGVTPSAVGVTKNDDVILAGTFDSSIDLGAGAVTGPGMFVARLSSIDGSCPGTFPAVGGLWARIGTATTEPTHLYAGVDQNDGVTFGGDVTGTLMFDGDPWSATGGGGKDMLLGKVDATGARASLDVIGGPMDDAIVGLAVDPVQGTAGVAAVIGSTIVLDPGHPGAVTVDPANGSALLTLWSAGQNLIWHHQYASSGNTPGIAFDPTSDMTAFIGYAGKIDFGAHATTAGANGSLALMKLDPTGKVLWNRSFDASVAGGSFFPPGLGVDANGMSIVGSTAASTVNFGAGDIKLQNGLPFVSFLARFGK